MLRTLGIDPGLDGGLALLSDDGLLVEVMPTRIDIYGKREVDSKKLAGLIAAWKPQTAALEKVGARPKQGVVSMFTFGQGVGACKGVLDALGVGYGEFFPKQWQKFIARFFDPSGGNPKENALSAAGTLFPRTSFLASGRCRKPHNGMIDAALIAYFAARMSGADI